MKAVREIGYEGWANAEPAWYPAGVEAQVRLKTISEKMDAIFAM